MFYLLSNGAVGSTEENTRIEEHHDQHAGIAMPEVQVSVEDAGCDRANRPEID